MEVIWNRAEQIGNIRHYDIAVKAQTHNAIKAYSSVIGEKWPLTENTHALHLLNLS